MSKSRVHFSSFDPTKIPYQYQVIEDIEYNYNHNLGVHEILLSGAVGSAKSELLAHLVIRHCIEYPNAVVLICRKALPDLKETIWLKILSHMAEDFLEGEDYEVNFASPRIIFSNGAKIITRTWHDKNYKKFRSLELSMVVIEELTENNEDDKQAYDEIKLRLNRIPGINKNIMISASNPDSPSHWVYRHFELHLDSETNVLSNERSPTKHVYYSVTDDNPFLAESYKEQLKSDLDPKMYERMAKGRWIEIKSEVIYHAYSKKHNFINSLYQIDEFRDIHINFDFNIGLGKPLSVCLFQVQGNKFHIFEEIIVHGSDTQEALEEISSRGLLNYELKYRIHGDATGASKHTASKLSDYDIIRKFLDNYRGNSKIDFSIEVPKSNPPIRTRHNLVNAYCKNQKGEFRLFVYKNCPTLDKGLSLTSFKKGGQFIEDDSKEYQHVTTALGYGIVWIHNEFSKKQSFSQRQLR